MSTIHDRSRHGRDAQEGYSQYHVLHESQHNGTGGPSSRREKTVAEDPHTQNSDDDDAQVNSELVTIWTQRLQLLTVVSSFLASMDGQLFSLSALNTQIGVPVTTASREMIYSCLAGALIFHVCAALLSYVASFALVRYRIVETVDADETKRRPRRVIAEPCHPLQLFIVGSQFPTRLRLFPLSRSSSPPPPPMALLTRCYFTTLGFSALGFILALAGILLYAWNGLPEVVGITSSVCVGIGISAAIWAIAL